MLGFQKTLAYIKKQPETIQLIYIYRIFSLVFTSIYYFFGATNHAIGRKVFIISCITACSLILSHLYIRNIGQPLHIMVLAGIETVGNIFLLIPSGGANSPYVWYCLNTILILSFELKKRYCWINLAFYLVAISVFTRIGFYTKITGLNETGNGDSNIALGMILVTAAVHFLSKYSGVLETESRKLTTAIEQLNLANGKVRKSMFYIMELYQAINLLSSQNEKQQVFELINRYARKITASDLILFYAISNDRSDIIADMGKGFELDQEQLKDLLERIPDRDMDNNHPIPLAFADRRFVFVPVKSGYIVYGLLGMEVTRFLREEDYKENMEQLKILSRVSSIVLEKIELEMVNGRLLVAEEQNRIASEIHDSVLQRLFDISCHIYSLLKGQAEKEESTYAGDLKIIRNSIREIMKDLRSAIYGLSWQKNGKDNFLIDLRSRINEIRIFSGNEISLSVTGDTSLLSVEKKKALYRIICEGIGNALHHGKARKVKVELKVEPVNTKLEITDNGTGFDMNDRRGHKGMGLGNIHHLTHFFGGKIQFDSAPGKGTRIEISLPNNQSCMEEII